MLAALGDDLNTPLALKGLRDLASAVRLGGDGGGEALGQFVAGLSLMGISPTASGRAPSEQALDRAFGAADSAELRRADRGDPEGARGGAGGARLRAGRRASERAAGGRASRSWTALAPPANGRSVRTSIRPSSTGSRHETRPKPPACWRRGVRRPAARAALALRHDAQRRAAEPGGRLLGRGQGGDRLGARRARDRLCRGRLAGGEPDRQRLLRSGAAAAAGRGSRRSG